MIRWSGSPRSLVQRKDGYDRSVRLFLHADPCWRCQTAFCGKEQHKGEGSGYTLQRAPAAFAFGIRFPDLVIRKTGLR